MEAFALYLLKVHIAVSVLYAIYYLAVRNELYFTLNRFILLAILLFSFSLPLLPTFSTGIKIENSPAIFDGVLSTTAISDPIKGKEVSKFEDEIAIKRMSGVVTTLVSFYLCGVLYFFLRFWSQISNVLALIRSSRKADGDYLDPEENIPAFSFFNFIVINNQNKEADQLRLVIAHERAHVKQMHSADIITAELASVLLWGNPVIKALKSTIRMNLEFLADQEVLRQGFDKKTYQWSILKPYLERNHYPLTNLYNSRPKQRIEKMNAGQASSVNLYKYALILPFVILIYIGIVPLHAAALDKIHAMKLIDGHEYRNYLGYYEFERDKGSFVKITMKDETLIMNTLWNNQKIYFQKQSENTFVNPDANIPLAFPKDYEGAVTSLVAFGDDRWIKVQKYIPVEKPSGEGTVISRTSSGGMKVMVYAIEPWKNVRHYSIKKAVSSP